MSNESERVKSVFLVAIEDYTPEQWDQYLAQECQDEPDVRRQVEVLLQAHAGTDSLLDQPEETIEQAATIERAGTVIGPYKLLEKIGEGGMGVVYMAEQTKPVERRVALKIIKPGMDSRQVIARFEAERTALAMMDHPNIARVLDAGTTESGRPYFVMELVKGIPITTYCDEQHLTPRQRLKLLVSVCHAVQHAHQKGIIHRDLKPANVLVAHYDNVAVPKVIDFGVAKATGKRLTDKTYFTRFDQVVGTLEYMSPEQVRFNQRDIDTRSDIYSLGVILYELLTGATPFEPDRLRSAAIDELLRIIREEEPPKPSTRLSSSSGTPSMTVENCGTEPHKLLKLLRGDLDWLILKALDKERDRRYETANGMAADIERYLAGDPIEARPPSTAYRLSKFARRHKAMLTTSALILAALIASTGILWSAVIKVEAARVDAANERDAAKATLERLRDYLIERAILFALTGDKETEAAIQLAEDAGVSHAMVRTIQGIHLYHAGNSEAAIAVLREVLNEDSKNVLARAMLLIALVDNAKWCEASSTLSRCPQLKEDTDDTGYEALFRGYALRYFDRRLSESTLQTVVDDHPTWAFARMMLGCVKADIATRWEGGDRVNEALRETKLVYQTIGDNRMVAQAYLNALSVAIHCATVAGEPFDELRQEADTIALLLKNKYPEFRLSNAERGLYYMVVGDMDAAEKAWEAAWGGEDAEGPTFHYAAILVRLGRQQDAVAMFDKIELTTPLAKQAKACFVLGTPGGYEKARLLCEDVIQNNSESKHAKLFALQMFCLLGDLDRVRKESKRFAKECVNDDFHKWINTWFEFFAEPERLEMFKRECDDSPERRLQFHYNAGFYFLAIHDKDKAKYHFEQCIDEGVVDGWTYWAMAYVKLLEDNPNWPYTEDSQGGEPSTN